jgi:translocation and assembly module TamB
MNRLLRISLVVLAVVVLLGVAARFYLCSGHVAFQVAARLEALYGGPVRVASADVGVAGSSVSGLELFEKGKADSQTPWASVKSLTADVSVFGLLAGTAIPQNVTLDGAAVTLRFDQRGRLLTRLPEPPPSEPGKEVTLPNVRIERARVTLQKEGGPALVVTGVNATLTRQGDRLVLVGGIDNPDRPALGKWSLHGELDGKGKTATVTLSGERTVHVTQALLDELPFVPPEIWHEVRVASADATVTAKLRIDLARQEIHYRVEMEPRNAVVSVPAIELAATDGEGKVILDDGVVELRDVRGRAFGGTIRGSGELDFRTAGETRLHFPEVAVKGLVVRQLPKSWDVPRQIEGRLQGSAWIDAVVVKGKPRWRGEGKGEIVDARVAGQPAAEPVGLELHAREGGFGFRNPADTPKEQAEGPAFLLPLLISTTSFIQKEQPGETPLAARAVNGLAAALELTLQGARKTASELVLFLPKQLEKKPPAPGRTVDVNLKLQKVDLAKFVNGLGLKLPFEVGGRLSFQVKASIPLDTSGDLKTYRAQGSAEVTRLRLAGVELDELRGDVDYANGVLRVPEATGRMSSGKGAPDTLRGSARLQVVPLGELTADLKMDRVPLSQAAALAGAANQVQGNLSGSIAVRSPAAKLADVNAWEAAAKITTRQVRAFGWTAQDGESEAHLRDGVLALNEVRVLVEGGLVTGSAELKLAQLYPFQGKFALRGWDLSALQRLSPEVRPPVPVAGQLDTTVSAEGTLQLLSLRTTGTARARELKVADLSLNDLDFAWKSDNDRLTLDKVHARLYGGAADGKAVLPLHPTVGGSVELRLKDVDVGTLAKSVPGMPFRIEGKAGGTVKGTLPPAPAGKDREAAVDVILKATRLKVQGIPSDQFAGTVGYHQGTLDYRFEGKALGGTFELSGAVPAAGQQGKEGRLQVKGAWLSGLGVLFDRRADPFPLRGILDLDVRFRHARPDLFPVGSGRFTVTRLRWGDNVLAERLEGGLDLERQEVLMRRVTADVGEGRLRARAGLSLRRPGEGWFTVNLEGVETAALLAPFPDLAGKVRGRVEARLRGRLDREWTGGGDVLLGRGKVLGVEVIDWRLPLTWSFSPGAGRGELSVRDSAAHLTSGRATGQATLGWGDGVRLEGNVRFSNVELRSVVRDLTDSTQFGSGRVTGRFDFSGHDMRSLNDLTGTLQAKLAQAQAFQSPVLYQVAPYLGIQTSFAFDQGELRARLSRGAARIENLSLWVSNLRVLVVGTVAFAGRLDLDVTARTGSVGFDPTRLAQFGLATPLPAFVPVTVLGRVSRYLSNRLIHLRVTGTVRNPNVRLEPLSLLTQEALQFFLEQANVLVAMPFP